MTEHERAELDATLVTLMHRLAEIPDGDDRLYFGGRLFRMAKELLPPDCWAIMSRVLAD